MPSTDDNPLNCLTHLAVPKGRIEAGVTRLLAAAGIAKETPRLPVDLSCGDRHTARNAFIKSG